MIKIGLITWFGSDNFGTNLQAYALQKRINDLGYSCNLIAYFKYDELNNLKERCLYVLSRLGLLRFLRKIKSYNTVKRSKINAFIENDLFIESIYSQKQYLNLLKHYSVFMTGSDQIWNPYFLKDFYLLDFVKGNAKCIAYASSIGVTELPSNTIHKYKQGLSKFSYIGVREDSACKILKKILLRDNISKVLDPTFLLLPQDWIDFSKKAEIEVKIPKEYIFCYLIGNKETYKANLLDVKRKTGISNIVIIESAENKDFDINNAIKYANAGPKEFIYLLKNSKFVCTDSFHATALSINLSKDFVEFVRFDDNNSKSQNSRIYDLLRHYNLEDRLYSKDFDTWSNAINYSIAQEILEKDRVYSNNFLINAIEN